MFDKLREKIKEWLSQRRARGLLREFYRKSFAQVCVYLKTNYIAVDSVDIYINNALPFIAVLEQYKQKKERELAKKDKPIIDLEKPLASDFLNKARDTLLLLQEEIAEVQRTPALTPVDAVSKNNKLAKLQKNIENIELTILAQEQILKQIMPPKRKVGRPKKTDKPDTPEERKESPKPKTKKRKIKDVQAN